MYYYTAQQLVKHAYIKPSVRMTSVVRMVSSAAVTVINSTTHQYKSVSAVHRLNLVFLPTFYILHYL